MKVFDLLLLDLILITMPIMVYLIFIAYSKTLNKEENKLIFVFVMFSEVYFIFKYGKSLYHLPLIIINTPLIISYLKKTKPMIIALSVLMIIYYYVFYNNYLFFLIIEYIIYYLISLKTDKLNFIITFSILKTIILIIINGLDYQIIISGILFFLASVFSTYILEQTESILKLRKSIKKIEHDKQIKTSLFRITHEIKNPIAVCKGYLDMYDENKIDDVKRYMPIIKEEIDRTLILLEDFLSMNKLKIKKELLDINLLLEEVVENMKIIIKHNHINLNVNIDDDEIYINGDYNRLMQVFINIFKNSIEALENRNNKQIKLWTDIKKDNIKIYIEDNGIGIPKNIMDKIKEPFYTTKAKGTGLGVSLSNEIIEAHNGHLRYYSKEGEKTTVTITLPLEKAI